MSKVPVAFMAILAISVSGCFSFGTTALHETPPPPVATVNVGEIQFDTALASCVESVADLPGSDLYRRDDPRLQYDRLIVVAKQTRRVMLFSNGKLRHDRPDNSQSCWKVALGVDQQGRPSGTMDKTQQGDRRTPEGWFRTSDKPWSQYQDAILIHYPSTRHAQRALEEGRIQQGMLQKIALAELAGTPPPQDTVLGGEILLHGGGSQVDWTWGCIALNNNDLDELRALLPAGMKTWMLILP